MSKKAVCRKCKQMVRVSDDGRFVKHQSDKNNAKSPVCPMSGEPVKPGAASRTAAGPAGAGGAPVGANLIFSCNCPRGWRPETGTHHEDFKRPFNLAMNGFVGMFGMPDDIDVQIHPSENRMLITLRVTVDGHDAAVRMKEHFDWLLRKSGLRYDGDWG